MILRILFFLISLLLYLNAPKVYDYNFCFWCMLLYLIEVGIFLKKEFSFGNYLTFNFIFFFSFFWTSFAYPVFVFGTPAGYLSVMVDHIDWSVLSRSTSLCLLFTSTYILGYGNPKFKTINNSYKFQDTNGKSIIWLKIAFIMLLSIALVSLIRAGFSYKEFTFNPSIWDLYFILLALCLIEQAKKKSLNCNLKEFYYLNKFPLLSALFIVLMFIMFGDRGPVIKVILITGGIYNLYYKKIKLKQIAIAGVFGLALMFFVRQTRENDNLIAAASQSGAISRVFELKNGAIYMFADLYCISMELNIAYSYAETHSLYHPERILVMPLSAVPFLPSIVLGLCGMSVDDFSTAFELNRQMAEFNSTFGTHVVGDLYMSTGLLGVIVFSYILGKISKYLALRKFSDPASAVAYMMLFAAALYLPRDSVFSLVRPLALSYILVVFLCKKRRFI